MAGRAAALADRNIDTMKTATSPLAARLNKLKRSVRKRIGWLGGAVADRAGRPEFAPRGEVAPDAANGTASASTAVRLNLGCGDKLLPGYVNVDVAQARAGKSPDVLCDLRDLGVFESDSADEVMAIHVVEHFWRWEIEAVLREWVRVLKPGGTMVIECPNLKSACEAFLADPETGSRPDKAGGQSTMWVFYGDPQWQDPLMVHRWGYTPHSLRDLLASVGLVEVRQEAAQFKKREPRDMRIVGRKPLQRA
ncbi:MAG: methyltransferase domain-containing protein [Methylibium sp.]|nr:methyltransferase domain-containing protein [Methylibium sp.]